MVNVLLVQDNLVHKWWFISSLLSTQTRGLIQESEDLLLKTTTFLALHCLPVHKKKLYIYIFYFFSLKFVGNRRERPVNIIIHSFPPIPRLQFHREPQSLSLVKD